MPAEAVVRSTKFDQPGVMTRVEKGERRALMRFGAFTRRRSRQLFRKRKSVSAPFAPPSSHLGLVKNKILFAVDWAAKSVVIGPEQLPGKPPDALRNLESGGQTIRLIRGRRVEARYRPRPFMSPSFEYERRVSLPGILKDSIK